MRLEDRVAIVTGGARGIGRGAALELARDGARVVVADRRADEAKAVAERIQKETGRPALGLAMEQTRPEEVTRMVEATVKEFGEINILFANAGFSRLVPFLDITAEQWQRMIDVNLTGTFSVCQAVARQMVAQRKGGRMIVTASVMADYNGNQQAHYCAAKAGVKLLGKCMAAELGNHRITVNVISPGVIATEMTTPLLEEAGIANMVRAITPLGRWGEAREVGRLVAFLASDDAAYINGQVINVDGGQSLPLVPPWRPLDYTEPYVVDWETPRQRYPFLRS